MQILRVGFLLLVLGNLLLFAWSQGYFGARNSGGEPERLAAQIQAEKLRIAARGSPAAALSSPPELPREACSALTGLDRETAGKLAIWLTGRDAELKLRQRTLEDPKSWWVYIPPQSSSAQADKKAAELSKLGVKDSFVIRKSGPHQYAVSLGLFKNEEGAKEYLATLKSKGVNSARILARDGAGDGAEGSPGVMLEVRGSADRLAKALANLPPDYATAHKTECAHP